LALLRERRGVKQGGIEREIEFLRLRSEGVANGEAGEKDGLSPEFIAEILDQVHGSGAEGFFPLPLGSGQMVARELAVLALKGGTEQERVGGDGAAGEVLHGWGGADLGVAEAEEGFLVAEVEFDVPAPQEGLDGLGQGSVGVGADQKGGLAVQEFAVFAQPVGSGSDDDELEIVLSAGGAPAQGTQLLDAQGAALAAEEDVDGLPGDRGILAQLLGGGGGRAVNAGAALGELGVGQEVKFGVGANATEENGVGGQIFEQRAVGEGAVDGAPQGPLSGAMGVEPGAEVMQAVRTDGGNTAGFALGAPVVPLGGFGVGPGFLRQGGMDPIDGDHAGLAVGAGGGQGGLQEALRPDEVDAKRGSQGIAQILGALHFLPGFSQTGFIHGRDQGASGALAEALADGLEELFGRDAAAFVQPVVGAPVLELSAAGLQQTGDRMGSQTGQLSQQVLRHALRLAFCAAVERPAAERLEGVQQWRSVFFTVTGEAGT